MPDQFFGTHTKPLNKEIRKVMDFYSEVLIGSMISSFRYFLSPYIPTVISL